MKKTVGAILIVGALLAGCATPIPSPTAPATEGPAVPTATAVSPTEVSATAPAHTATPAPTVSPTSKPTDTPAPTHIPTTPAATPELLLLAWPFDRSAVIAGINYFDLDQSQGYDADKNDANGAVLNCACDSEEGWRNVDGFLVNIVDGHRGVDYYLRSGTPVLAVKEGVVEVRRGEDMAWISHVDGTRSAYAHFVPFHELDGQHVERGQPIGVISENAPGGDYDYEGEVFHELHYGLMIRDGSMTLGWRSIDPYYGPCSNPIANPFGRSLWQEADPLPSF